MNTRRWQSRKQYTERLSGRSAPELYLAPDDLFSIEKCLFFVISLVSVQSLRDDEIKVRKNEKMEIMKLKRPKGRVT